MLLRCLLIFCLLILQPVTAFAYSYGDPNKEDVAETYKEIAARLEKSPEDWAGAISTYNGRKAEIALEFGESVANTIESNLNNKQKDLVLHNYRVVLVKNVERRLKSVETEFNDYAKAKLMLAKGRGTFAVLEPFVGDAGSKKVYESFDKALTALGNPGLFGVGVVPANKQAFLDEKKQVMTTLAPLSAIKAASAPDKQEPAKQSSKPAAANPAPDQSKTQPTEPAAGTNTQQPSQQPAAGQTQPASGTQSAPSATQPENESASGVAAPTEAPADSKVNLVVTISVIGGILVIAGGALWLGKRKGLL